MVHATNAGGEAQSIADFAVFEPTPDTMIEVHKTLVYENVQDKDIVEVSSCCILNLTLNKVDYITWIDPQNK